MAAPWGSTDLIAEIISRAAARDWLARDDEGRSPMESAICIPDPGCKRAELFILAGGAPWRLDEAAEERCWREAAQRLGVNRSDEKLILLWEHAPIEAKNKKWGSGKGPRDWLSKGIVEVARRGEGAEALALAISGRSEEEDAKARSKLQALAQTHPASALLWIGIFSGSPRWVDCALKEGADPELSLPWGKMGRAFALIDWCALSLAEHQRQGIVRKIGVEIALSRCVENLGFAFGLRAREGGAALADFCQKGKKEFWEARSINEALGKGAAPASAKARL